jgi:hypothetical protein
MNKLAKPFLVWPGWDHLRFGWLLTLAVGAWFAMIYVGSDWLTAHRASRVRVHLAAELRIPLMPSFTLVYMSVYLLFLAAPFILRARREIAALAKALAVAIAVAAIGFLLVPAQLAYPVASDAELGVWRGLFRFADRLNLDYNLVPSLHIALSTICIEFFAGHAASVGRFLLRGWGFLIAASTILTHQHHLLDAVTGYFTAFVTVRFIGRNRH